MPPSELSWLRLQSASLGHPSKLDGSRLHDCCPSGVHIVGAAPRKRRGLVEKRAHILLLSLFLVLLGCFIVSLAIIATFGVCGGENWCLLSSLAHRHVVFLLEVSRVHLIVVQYELLVCHLLLGRVVDAVVPFEVYSLEREVVFNHSRQELVVDHIPQHVAVLLDEALEDLQVRFGL